MDDFAEFYAEHAPRMTVQLFAFTGDLAVAQDVVQEAFTRAVPRWKTLSQYDDPAAWVRRVAFNLARSRWRHGRVALRFLQRQREEYVDGPAPDRVELLRALEKLPERQRQAVVLHYLAGLSVAEIASHMGSVEGTVKSWLSRARAALATYLSDSEEVRRA